MTILEAKALKQGQKVRISPMPWWYETKWFPQGEITGIVEKVNSRGRVDVAVDQLPAPAHQHEHRTLQFHPSEVELVEY